MARRRGDAARPLPQRTREAVAACDAVGLAFWSDHPRSRHFWAVDDHQHAHVVRIDRDAGTAQHVCGEPGALVSTEWWCMGIGEPVVFANETEKEPPPQQEAVPDTPPKSNEKGRPMSNLQPPTLGLVAPPNGEVPGARPNLDPFDPETLRNDALADVEVETVLTSVPVRKPKRTEFFRVHPSRDYTLDLRLLERDSGMELESYLVTPSVQHLVLSELRQVRLFTAINKRGVVFLWPIKLPRDDNDRITRIADTALQGAEQAKSLWVKLAWDRDLGGYQMQRAKGDLGTPQWPDKSFRDLIEIAFRRNLIDRQDHPVIRELAGEL